MPLAPADRSLLDPAALAAHSFATGFRGYDQDEVRRFLGQVADAVGRLVDVQAGLERRLAAAESRAAAPRPFDEAELAAALGEETARVLMAARQAATDIRSKAEEGASRLLEEAANEAAARRRAADEHASKERAAVAELRRTAEAELAERRSAAEAHAAEAGRTAEAAAADLRRAAAADVERLLEDARADADARRADADARRADAIAAATAARAEADAEVSRRRADAEALLVARSEEAEREAQRIRANGEEERTRAMADAEAQREAAKEEGRALVDEAELVRERVLRDLARRRRTARGQIEQLRVARERLLEAYEVVRRTLDEATGELRVALPEARLAAEEAGRRVEAEPEVSVDNLEAELEMARAAGLPIVMVDDRVPGPPARHDLAGGPSGTDAAGGAKLEAPPQPEAEPQRPAQPQPQPEAEPPAQPQPQPEAEAEPQPDAAAIDPIPDVGSVPDVRIVGAVVAGEAAEPGPGDPPSPVPEVASPAEPPTPEVLPSTPADPSTTVGPAAGPGSEAEATEPDPTPRIHAGEPSPESAGPVAGPETEASRRDTTTVPTPVDDADPEPAAGEAGPGREALGPALTTPTTSAEHVEALAGQPDDASVRSVEGPTPESVVDDSGSESEIPGPTAVPPDDEPTPEEPAPDDGSPERPGQAQDEAAVRAEVDALFARIRASRGGGTGAPTPSAPAEQTGATATATTTESAVSAASAGSAVAIVKETEPGEPAVAVATKSEPTTDVSTEPDTAGAGLVTLLERRDAAIEETEHRLARRLKRVLADEQSAVLDTVRRSRSLPRFDDVLPSPADHVASYVDAACEDLTAAAEVGARFAEGPPPPGTAGVDDLAAGLADELIGRLRPRLERCFVEAEAGDGDARDEEELNNRIRACYREWKTTQIAEVARHVVLAAFSRGQYDALPADTPLQWVIDDSGQPCPDAEDNALAGAVEKGKPFPTGHNCPPAHPGCRCLVVPARR